MGEMFFINEKIDGEWECYETTRYCSEATGIWRGRYGCRESDEEDKEDDDIFFKDIGEFFINFLERM